MLKGQLTGVIGLGWGKLAKPSSLSPVDWAQQASFHYGPIRHHHR